MRDPGNEVGYPLFWLFDPVGESVGNVRRNPTAFVNHHEEKSRDPEHFSRSRSNMADDQHKNNTSEFSFCKSDRSLIETSEASELRRK